MYRVISMKDEYLLIALAVASVSVFAIGIAGAHINNQGTPMMGNGFGMDSMMGMMQGNFVHDEDDIQWMKKMMKDYMNFTDEEFDEMAEHCPMMRAR